MHNISSTAADISDVNTNQSDSSSLKCTTCQISADEKTIKLHAYNCPEKHIPCNICLKDIKIKEIPLHKTKCTLQEIKYYLASKFHVKIKQGLLLDIQQADKLLDGTFIGSNAEKLEKYKQTITAYATLMNKLVATQTPSIFLFSDPKKTITYDEYKETLDKNIELLNTSENQQLSNSNTQEELYKKYIQQTIEYKIDRNLPAVSITIEELLHIKLAEKHLHENNMDDSDVSILFYQQAIKIYKNFLDNLKVNTIKLEENQKTGAYTEQMQYSITEKVKVDIPEFPLYSENYRLDLTRDKRTLGFSICRGKIFSFLSAKNDNVPLHKFKPGNNSSFSTVCPSTDKSSCWSHDLEIKLNVIPNYHTNDNCGIYFLLTNNDNFMAQHDPLDSKYFIVVSYIDKQYYKNLLFKIAFTADELFTDSVCIDQFDKTTKFGFINTSEKFRKLNRFFNDDGIGMEYIKNHGYDSIFAVEFYTPCR